MATSASAGSHQPHFSMSHRSYSTNLKTLCVYTTAINDQARMGASSFEHNPKTETAGVPQPDLPDDVQFGVRHRSTRPDLLSWDKRDTLSLRHFPPSSTGL